MMARGHAMGGAAVWLTGWSWTTVAGLTEPGADVLIIGTFVCAGAALLPDWDHPQARLAQSAGWFGQKFAAGVGRLGAAIHARTKLAADRPDRDGHRTITHTAVFAIFIGFVIGGIAGASDDLGEWLAHTTGKPIAVLGKLLAAAIVFTFVQIGAATLRSNWGGRRKRVALLPPKKGRRRGRVRVHKSTAIGLAAAVFTYVMVPADVWWLGFAVGVGSFAHCLGDLITIGGCPILWPIPIRSRKMRFDSRQGVLVPVTRYNKETKQREVVRQWRTWYLVGTPKWMRFPVNGPTEWIVTLGLFALCLAAVSGIVYAMGWGAAAG